MAAGKRLVAGVVGMGVGEQHAIAYDREEHCELRWLYDLDPRRATAAAGRIGAGRPAPSFEAILADQEVDMVSIASYDDHHHAQVCAALAAGKHVFVEKPLCRTPEELAEIHRIWATGDRLVLRSNLVLRAAEIYLWLKRQIEQGVLGEVYAFDGDYLYGRLHKITDGWRKDVDNYSAMQGGGVHMIDLMLWLTGQRPVSVQMLGNNICTEGTDFKYNDFMAATFRFDSGLIGRITANFGCVHRHHHVVRVFGTRATFIHDDQGPRLHVSRDESDRAKSIDLPTLPKDKGCLIEDFVDAVRRANDHAAAAREFALISVCAAADLSAVRNEVVRIEYLT